VTSAATSTPPGGEAGVGLQLPGELIWLLGELGYNWPEADEEQLFHMANVWLNFAGTVSDTVSAGMAAARPVWTVNQGDDVAAFEQTWNGPDAPPQNLTTAGTSCTIVGVGMMCAAAIVLALKIEVIVQLVLLAIEIAQALATAPETFGATLAEIPIFKEITSLIVNELLNQAIMALLDG
jgi:hypothetical protein